MMTGDEDCRAQLFAFPLDECRFTTGLEITRQEDSNSSMFYQQDNTVVVVRDLAVRIDNQRALWPEDPHPHLCTELQHLSSFGSEWLDTEVTHQTERLRIRTIRGRQDWIDVRVHRNSLQHCRHAPHVVLIRMAQDEIVQPIDSMRPKEGQDNLFSVVPAIPGIVQERMPIRCDCCHRERLSDIEHRNGQRWPRRSRSSPGQRTANDEECQGLQNEEAKDPSCHLSQSLAARRTSHSRCRTVRLVATAKSHSAQMGRSSNSPSASTTMRSGRAKNPCVSAIPAPSARART